MRLKISYIIMLRPASGPCPASVVLPAAQTLPAFAEPNKPAEPCNAAVGTLWPADHPGATALERLVAAAPGHAML